MTNAATKMAFGIVGDVSKSKNPEMTKLISKIVKTVYQVKSVDVMGTLFTELCEFLDNGKSTTLVNFRVHRFVGLTSVLHRIFEKWSALEQ